MVVDRREIRFEAEEVTEDGVLWIDMHWRDFRLENGHCMDDKTWMMLYRGKFVAWVRSVRKAKDEILKIMEDE